MATAAIDKTPLRYHQTTMGVLLSDSQQKMITLDLNVNRTKSLLISQNLLD